MGRFFPFLKSLVRCNYHLFVCSSWLRRRMANLRYLNQNKISSRSSLVHIFRDCIGSNNRIVIGEDCIIRSMRIRIRGSNNSITLGDHLDIGPDCSLWIEGNNCRIEIGDHTTMTVRCHLNVQENDRSIVLGSDCMLSNNIVIRTSDSHPIFAQDKGGGESGLIMLRMW